MRILCFGDSNTYGYDPRGCFGSRYSPEDRWPELLAAQTGWTVINEGINGRQIPRNPYTLRLLREEKPNLFLVMLGTNDLLQGSSPEEAAARMERFLYPLLPYCPEFLLIAPPPMKRGAWVPSDTLVHDSILLIQEYASVAQRLQIAFADTRSWNIPLVFDGVHFSEDGHHRFAEEIKKSIFLLDSPPA